MNEKNEEMIATTQEVSIGDAVRQYLNNGWNVVPVLNGSKRPILDDWNKTNFTESDFQNEQNIGIQLGERSGWLIDIDLDCHEAIVVAQDYLPPTKMKHGRNSHPTSHWWYVCKGATTHKFADATADNNEDKTRKSLVELRSTGSQTIVPPSIYSDTEQLKWEGESIPSEVEYSELLKAVKHIAAVSMIAKRWDEGIRHDLALSLNGLFALGGMEKSEAIKFVKSVCRAAYDKECNDRLKAVEDTYEKAHEGQFVEGYSKLVQLLGEKVVIKLVEWLNLRISKSSPITDLNDDRRLRLTDLGNAERLIQYFGDKIRFVKEWGWLIWDGKRWHSDEDGEITRLASETVKKIYVEAGNCQNHYDRQKLAQHGRQSESRGRIESMVKLAASFKDVAMKPEHFDGNPWLINVNNGTLNLKTFEIKTHNPEDYITKLAPVTYEPTANCLLFEKFVNRIFNQDSELIDFVQKSLGYILTGSTREQIVFVEYGVGANGKSTLNNTILNLLGEDYAQQARAESFMQKKYDGIPNDIARFRGARFLSAIEIGENGRLNEPLVKTVTGGEPLTVRFLHKEYFQFKPEFKLFLATNHKPTIHGTDHGIWRRIRLIPFTVIIPEGERDPDLEEKLMREKEGILAWMIKGCQKYLSEGLKSPSAVECHRANQNQPEMGEMKTSHLC